MKKTIKKTITIPPISNFAEYCRKTLDAMFPSHSIKVWWMTRNCSKVKVKFTIIQ